LTITPNGSGIPARYFNVYRSAPGASRLYVIGKVKNSGAATTVFTDLNNRLAGGITAFAIDFRGCEIPELSPFKSVELARTDLTSPKAFFRFCSLAVKLPRFSQLIDNVTP